MTVDLTDYGNYDDIKTRFAWEIPKTYNIADRVLGPWTQDASRVALFHEDELGRRTTWTFGQLNDLTNQVANLLASLGVKRGERVGIILPQCPEAAAVHLAVYRSGAVALPMSMLYGPDSYRYIMDHAGVRAVVVDGSHVDKIRNIRHELPNLRQVIVRGPGGDDEVELNVSLNMPTTFVSVPTKAWDPALLLYTSGTTGHPKGALHAHRILAGYLLTFQLFFNLDFDEFTVFWTPSDWAWVGGLLDILLPSLALGHPVLASEGRFGAEKAYGLMSHYKVTHVFLAPTALKMLARVKAPRASYDLDVRVIASGGESVADEVLAWCHDELGAVCNEFYGLTEVNHLIGNCEKLWPVRPGSMGKAYPGREVEIVDAEGQPVGVSELGQIVVRPGDPTMMLEYWLNPEATGSRVKDGWVWTGDMAYQDADGYFFFKGRDDDMISSAGYRIGPAEVEEALMRHPAVAEAAVVGSPDPVRGQIIKAFIELADGYQASEALVNELQTFVKTNLAAYKYPREVEFSSNLPKTTTGKLNRKQLRLDENRHGRP